MVGGGHLLQRGKDEEGVIGVCVCVGGVEKASCSFLTKKKKSILCRELGLLLSPPPPSPNPQPPHPPCALCRRRADVTLIMLIVNCLCLSLPPSRQSSRRTRHAKSHLFRVFPLLFFFPGHAGRSRRSPRRPHPPPPTPNGTTVY